MILKVAAILSQGHNCNNLLNRNEIKEDNHKWNSMLEIKNNMIRCHRANENLRNTMGPGLRNIRMTISNRMILSPNYTQVIFKIFQQRVPFYWTLKKNSNSLLNLTKSISMIPLKRRAAGSLAIWSWKIGSWNLTVNCFPNRVVIAYSWIKGYGKCYQAAVR